MSLNVRFRADRLERQSNLSFRFSPRQSTGDRRGALTIVAPVRSASASRPLMPDLNEFNLSSALLFDGASMPPIQGAAGVRFRYRTPRIVFRSSPLT
jgi:hypothetical protein